MATPRTENPESNSPEINSNRNNQPFDGPITWETIRNGERFEFTTTYNRNIDTSNTTGDINNSDTNISNNDTDSVSDNATNVSNRNVNTSRNGLLEALDIFGASQFFNTNTDFIIDHNISSNNTNIHDTANSGSTTSNTENNTNTNDNNTSNTRSDTNTINQESNAINQDQHETNNQRRRRNPYVLRVDVSVVYPSRTSHVTYRITQSNFDALSQFFDQYAQLLNQINRNTLRREQLNRINTMSYNAYKKRKGVLYIL
ncbi:hypothetical protein EDEG_00739 [Edhazardia aedis USNM 41457]|uniref:Uncharacterized protein n=1 Tax=Edhazardia aedis (strain USNM 41457) TaxID=1003232 RepID=J8ZZV6_EDHAE|nr:hypothetical protein EDEG_00739 [Edhazardia aedis USNM 41457]|eukprot:EJW05173.1 hypothetical protein EDEG_00739 [Edhazardia aedis USNM 41457]